MHRRHRTRLTFHDLQVHQDFAGALFCSRKLVAFEINEAHILRLHETFRNQGRGAKSDIRRDADGNVTAVAIHISALPKAPANLANLELQFVDRR